MNLTVDTFPLVAQRLSGIAFLLPTPVFPYFENVRMSDERCQLELHLMADRLRTWMEMDLQVSRPAVFSLGPTSRKLGDMLIEYVQL